MYLPRRFTYGSQWQQIVVMLTVLKLRTKERVFEINSILLPKKTSYVAIRDFVNSRVRPKEKTLQPIEAGKYCFTCSYEGNGEIYTGFDSTRAGWFWSDR